MIYYVDIKAEEGGNGSKDRPFRYINEAAALAVPGDEVLVYPGIYRENVNPVRGGSEYEQIVYRSVEKHGAVISGAEPFKSWVNTEGKVWKAEIRNDFFTERNPFTTAVSGDWFIATITAHTGDVFLNEKSMYEVLSLDEVRDPKPSLKSWDPDFSVYTWYTEQDEQRDMTLIYANFGDYDPNKENVEISARKSCFYPEKEGVGHITLTGFKICKAATQWAPPTAYQEGMIGPHWSKGWVIEDCEIYESKCSGISLGKYLQPENDNKWLKNKFKDGTQTERECILLACRQGFTKEKVGSHTVRRCDIHDCGQTGIVGHLGGVFSLIEDNHIHHINNKQNLEGAEIGGIKMHAAIDVVYRRNHIHHCTRGLWLDWQAQGTRVTGNLFHDNALPFPFLMRDEALGGIGEDIFVEVSHGPTLIDNNILLSTRSLKLATQGVALVHNLIAGAICAVGKGTDNGAKSLISPRYTPYHVPHGTQVVGFMTFLHGDDRFYNNIFIQQEVDPFMEELSKHSEDNCWDDNNVTAGTHVFNGYPLYEEWAAEFEGYCGMGSPASDRYYMHLPVWSEGNLYLNGARPFEKEKNGRVDAEKKYSLSLVSGPDGICLKTDIDLTKEEFSCRMVDTELLGMAFEPEQYYENPDGTPITFDRDYFDLKREDSILPGPFSSKTLNGLLLSK